MHITNLRKVGGSVMLSVPPAILELLNLQVGSAVSVSIDGGRLVIEPQARPHYTMADLLAASDYADPISDEERQWLDAPPVGRELL